VPWTARNIFLIKVMDIVDGEVGGGGVVQAVA